MARLTLCIDFDDGRATSPGEVLLLELVGEAGSISAAKRAMTWATAGPGCWWTR